MAEGRVDGAEGLALQWVGQLISAGDSPPSGDSPPPLAPSASQGVPGWEKAKAAAIRVALQEMGVVLSDQRTTHHTHSLILF